MSSTQAVSATATATPRNVRSSYPFVTSTPTSKTRTYSGTRRSGSLFFSIGTTSYWRICQHTLVRFFSHEILLNFLKIDSAEVLLLQYLPNKTQNAALVFFINLCQF